MFRALTTSMGDQASSLFVYGTLLPGDVRWPILEPFVVDEGVADSVPGRLFDTGLDYPAAIFDPQATEVVHGRRYLLANETLNAALVQLDIEEDVVLGFYRRVAVLTVAGVEAWAYQYGEGLDLTPIPSGDWFNRPPR